MQCHCGHNQSGSCVEIVPIFHSLTHEEMDEVARIAQAVTFQRGDQIYAMGDHPDSLFVIHTGRVKVYRLSDTGKEQVLRVLGPGDFLGELSLFSHTPMSDFSEALEEGTMCLIAGDRLRGLMGRYPQIAFKILEELSRRLERTEQLLENISLHSAERRLAAALLEMSEGSLEIRLSLSKGDLASQLGMTQETLSRRLTAFEGLGLIEQVGQRSIRLLDREELERIASGG